MRAAKVGFWIACHACGKKFESTGLAYCEACGAIPAETRRQMQPAGRQCEAPDCTNVISGTARIDARYCSKACRERARYEAKRQKNDCAEPDIGAPENLAFSAEKTKQNQRPKIEGDKRLGFSPALFPADAVLSNWKPTGVGKDMPDIPDFLRRDHGGEHHRHSEHQEEEST